MEENPIISGQEIIPEKIPSNSWKRIRTYLRELSIIIVGILITIGITSLVSNYNRQKELKGMLKLVTSELRENQEDLKRIWRAYEGEQHIFGLLRKSGYNLDEMSHDTLEKYSYAIGRLYSLEFKKDSYEVLKSSVLTQYVKEKGLMAGLSATYGRMEELSRQLLMYSNRKSEFFYPLVEKLETDEIEVWMSGSIYDWFNFPARERSFRTFVITGPTIISPGTFEYCSQIIQKTVAQLERYGY